MEQPIKRKAGRPKDSKSLNTNEILRTALRCFAKRGYGGVTINALAKETGVADSLLHYHFGNKEQLWKKATSLVGKEIHQELVSLFEVIDDLDGLEKLRLYTKKIIHISAKYPEFQQVVIQEVFSENPRSAWLIKELLRPIFSFMETILQEEMAKGRIKNIPPANLSSFIIGAITTLFTRSYQMKMMHGVDAFAPEEIDKQVEVVNDLLFNGLLNR